MSIDLDVFPTNADLFTWKQLKNKFQELLSFEDRERIGKPSLLKLNPKIKIEDDEQLSFHSEDHVFYYPSFDISSTLSIGITKNKSNYTNELEYLEDFGRNLDTQNIQKLAQQWKEVGYTYGLTTYAGRSKWEPDLFVALATAIAYLCQGYVIVMNDVFTVDVGVYNLQEFQQAKMTFSQSIKE